MHEHCSQMIFEPDALHKYHLDLGKYIRRCWSLGDQGQDAATCLPASPYFENLLSICYQASMLREEEHPVRLRLIVADPELFSAQDFPPMGLHRQIFTQPGRCNEFELRISHPPPPFPGLWSVWS